MKIKIKILSGFFLIILMLLIAGFMSVYEFSRVSKSVSTLIDDNYKTIEACRSMLEAVEREDSGVLLLISGHWKEGRNILEAADSMFNSAIIIAKKNITEENEDKYIEKIEQTYLEYKSKWETPIIGTDKENNINWYFTDLHVAFIAIKFELEALMTLNQDSMYKEATQLKEQVYRAIMPGIVAIISALIFLVIFNFFISKYFVNPIEKIIASLKNYNTYTQKFNADLLSNDELKELEIEIQNLINRIKK